MKRIVRLLLPPLILLTGIGIAAALISNGPKTVRQRPKAPLPTVEVMVLQPQSYKVQIKSRGTVMPKTESTLVAEVSGKVIQVAENFYPGGFFAAGDELLQIDPRDYQNAVTIAKAEWTLKRLALAEEQARSEQAQLDWINLKLPGTPTPLLLRTPQREHAEADLAAANARLQQAELNLERTRITAPYAGRILQKEVDLGQYLTSGTPLAQIYASDALEIRLPINNTQLKYLQLPEEFRNDIQENKQPGAKVLFSALIGEQIFHWVGQLIRTEGSIDINSRQLFVVAQITDPYHHQTEQPQLKIGQFIEAQILGNHLDNVYIIPRHAIHGDKTVHVIDDKNTLHRREIKILWRDEQQIISSGPLQPGERISLTTLPFAADGIKIRIAGESATDQPLRKTKQEQ